MTPTTKIITGVASLGVVGSGIGYAVSTQFATENISKKLENDGFKILDENENNEWTPILASYLATIGSKDNLKFKDFEIKIGETEKLKQACQKALESPSDNQDSYDKAKHWCTVPRTVSDLLDKEGYKKLSTKVALESDDNIDQEEWNKKLDEHAKDDSEFKDKKFKGDPNIKDTKAALKNKANRDAIKKQCDSLNKKKHYEVDFKANLEKSQIWCAVK